MGNKIKKIGNQIKAFREYSGFTQKSIAAYLQVDSGLISMAEKGEQALTADMLEKLADLFGVPLVAFEAEEVKMPSLSFALRASEIDETDMETIRAIHRIVLNGRFLTELLEKGNADG